LTIKRASLLKPYFFMNQVKFCAVESYTFRQANKTRRATEAPSATPAVIRLWRHVESRQKTTTATPQAPTGHQTKGFQNLRLLITSQQSTTPRTARN
jgi:hypothetical protein